MLSVGIIGLPNVGKSTLLNALLSREVAKVAQHPFTTIKANTGVVEVPDSRLDRLSKITGIKEKIPAQVKFIDIAGLVKGAHKGEGLGNEFLGHIREVDSIAHVLRGFEDKSVPHLMGTIDPVRDLEIVETELILKDLETINKAQSSKLKAQSCSPKLKAALEKVKKGLDIGVMVKDQNLSNQEKEEIEPFFLLTAKPTLYILNVGENQLTTHGKKPQVADIFLRKSLKEKVRNYLVICAKLESELGLLSKKEARAYLLEVGVTKSSLDKVICESYKLLNLFTFFTIAGGKKVQAWSIPKGTRAIEAAAKIHTDMKRGFIKAEVIPYQKLLTIGSWQKAKEEGRVEIKGKDYEVKDGEVVEFKFSV